MGARRVRQLRRRACRPGCASTTATPAWRDVESLADRAAPGQAERRGRRSCCSPDADADDVARALLAGDRTELVRAHPRRPGAAASAGEEARATGTGVAVARCRAGVRRRRPVPAPVEPATERRYARRASATSAGLAQHRRRRARAADPSGGARSASGSRGSWPRAADGTTSAADGARVTLRTVRRGLVDCGSDTVVCDVAVTPPVAATARTRSTRTSAVGLAGAVRPGRPGHRAVLPDLRRPRRRAAAAGDGARRPDDLVGPRPVPRCWPARGFYVIRYDNRDTGRSTRAPGPGDPPACWCAAFAGPAGAGAVLAGATWPTTRFGLLDHLGIESAHVVRRVDGRDDRADDGDRAARSGCAR